MRAKELTDLYMLCLKARRTQLQHFQMDEESINERVNWLANQLMLEVLHREEEEIAAGGGEWPIDCRPPASLPNLGEHIEWVDRVRIFASEAA